MMHIPTVVESDWCKPDFCDNSTFMEISFWKIKCSHNFSYDIADMHMG